METEVSITKLEESIKIEQHDPIDLSTARLIARNNHIQTIYERLKHTQQQKSGIILSVTKNVRQNTIPFMQHNARHITIVANMKHGRTVSTFIQKIEDRSEIEQMFKHGRALRDLVPPGIFNKIDGYDLTPVINFMPGYKDGPAEVLREAISKAMEDIENYLGEHETNAIETAKLVEKLGEYNLQVGIPISLKKVTGIHNTLEVLGNIQLLESNITAVLDTLFECYCI